MKGKFFEFFSVFYSEYSVSLRKSHKDKGQ